MPRLRIAPDVIAAIMLNDLSVDKDQDPIMYLGETNNHLQGNLSNRSKLRTVMVKGQVAFIEGREFRNLSPVFD